MDRIKLNAGDPQKWATAAEIRAAAERGRALFLIGIPCKEAANCNGYITAVTDKGVIVQEWAGAFATQ